MRWESFAAVSLVVIATGAPARAEPRMFASGFVGLGWLGDDTELGNSWAPEQVPGTAPVVGARLGYLVAPALIVRDGSTRLAFAVEAELAVVASYTGGSSFGGGRMSYFAPVFGWRAHAVLRAGGNDRVTPHLLAGGGGETVASSSPFMSKETDAIVYYGPGVTIPVGQRWQIRVDLRHGLMAGRTSATSSMFELQFGVGALLGAPAAAPRRRVDIVAVPPPPPPPLEVQPPPPPPDADRDGVVDATDACPTAAEDRDDFADDDGCPDLDDDADTIADATDQCPREPETRNGFTDDDGCPDEIPAVVTRAFTAASAVRFEARRARVTPAAQQSLRLLFALLDERRELRVIVVGHPDRAGNEDLARRRAEAVKWYLVDAGLTEDRIDTAAGAIGKAPISIVLPDPAAAAPKR
jgi:OOP family OmpA-OmpF porin